MRIPSPVALGAGLTTVSLALYGATYVPAEAAAPAAAAAPPTQVAAGASAEILHLSALNVPGAGTLADAGVGVSTGAVDGTGSPRSTADSANLTAALADQALPDLLAVASQQAPRDHLSPATARSIDGQVPGIVSLGVSTSSAQARWTADDSCPAPGAPLTRSSVSTADVATEEVPSAGALLTLPGTASTSQQTTLAGGDVRRVVSTARGSAADVGLLGGVIQVAVADAPTLRAVATGKPGGASVEWSAPLVRVTVNGQEREVPVEGGPIDITSPDNPLLHAELSVGQLTDVEESKDGTHASGSASVLHVNVSLGSGELGATVLDTDLFPLSASATAPEGGVACGDDSRDSDGDGLTDGEETAGTANSAFGSRPTDPNDPDSDGDGLSDGEEVSGSRNIAFDSAPSNPNNADTDRGGVRDGDEVARGTDPNDKADDSGPADGGADDPDGDGLTNAEEAEAGTIPVVADSDADGLEDGEEVKEHDTDPTNPDTDAGGVSDGDEVDRGTDPNDPSDDQPGDGGGNGGGEPSVQDPDGDGLDTTDELEAGSNPIVPDTDGDGLDDGEEVNDHQTAPGNADTDGDGLTDGREVSATDTKPRDADSDNDGLNDGREVNSTRSDPNRKDTDKDGLHDGTEVFGPAKQKYPRCQTSPIRKDSDKDGLQDGRELKKFRTNPCDWDSDNGGVSDGDEIKAGSDPNDPRSTPKHPRVGAASLLRPTG